MVKGTKQSNYIGQAWLVILLALVYGGALAGVQTKLAPRIAENKRNETYNVIPGLVPQADKTKTVELLIRGLNGNDVLVYEAISADGTHKGWVLPASGQGFSARIEMLIGVDAEVSRITGLYVLDQKETPGLGDHITDNSFRSQFVGAATDEPLVMVTSGPEASSEIRALTGATISSLSVSDIVNGTIANLKEPIRQQAFTRTKRSASCTGAVGNERAVERG
jgi:electron transport complex protein RnfG